MPLRVNFSVLEKESKALCPFIRNTYADAYSLPYIHVSTRSSSRVFPIKCSVAEKQFLQNQNFHRENLSSFFSFSLGKRELKYLVLKHTLKCVNYLQAENSAFLHL